MHRVFEDRLQNVHSDLLEDTRLDVGRNMLKTALIETNISPAAFREKPVLEEVIKIEEELLMVKTKNREGEGWLFVDVYDDRLWSIYSLTPSTFFKIAISDLLNSDGGGLDRLWLPSGHIEEIGDMGKFEGVKMSFEAENIFPEEFLEDNDGLRFTDLNISGSGRNSRDLYNILRQTEEVADYISLTRVQIRRERDGHFIRERVTNDGKFTTRGGDSIRLHLSTVEEIKARYEQLLTRVENHHRINATESDHGARASGGPVVIEFSHPIKDVERFLSHIVNSKEPFRLTGHIRQVNENACKVDAVDGHNGDRLTLEVADEWLRVYLHGDACGNTALRLFSNLQHYYDPAAELVIRNG
ncbi:Uncharacterized protein HSR122_2219 [Halapricum desulfuricans]|uniref:Uncharacterized protein n=2 Tax=Halapricum desulfuricans TaxID=2841257 RepID=A0A897N5C5_9EURY|nr:Uncharacterized protein HSR122_2219 [Halapricum desulfuricans]